MTSQTYASLCVQLQLIVFLINLVHCIGFDHAFTAYLGTHATVYKGLPLHLICSLRRGLPVRTAAISNLIAAVVVSTSSNFLDPGPS